MKYIWFFVIVMKLIRILYKFYFKNSSNELKEVESYVEMPVMKGNTYEIVNVPVYKED